MRTLLRALWADDAGAMLVTEWVFMATILIIGIIPGMIAVRDSLIRALHKSACQLNSSSCACSELFAATDADNPVDFSDPVCD